MTRILVTGSRDLTDTDLVHDALSEAFERYDGDVVVIHGGARGADRMAGAWARLMKRYGVKEAVFNADWRTNGRAAGPIRNQQMIDSKPDVVLAFYMEGAGNVGTSDCVKRARLAGLRVIEYTQPRRDDTLETRNP